MFTGCTSCCRARSPPTSEPLIPNGPKTRDAPVSVDELPVPPSPRWPEHGFIVKMHDADQAHPYSVRVNIRKESLKFHPLSDELEHRKQKLPLSGVAMLHKGARSLKVTLPECFVTIESVRKVTLYLEFETRSKRDLFVLLTLEELKKIGLTITKVGKKPSNSTSSASLDSNMRTDSGSWENPSPVQSSKDVARLSEDSDM